MMHGPETEPRFRQVVQRTARLAGYEADMSQYTHLDESGVLRTAVPDITGTACITMEEQIGITRGALDTPRETMSSVRFGLNGMLVEKWGTVHIRTIPNRFRLHPDDRPGVRVNVLPTTQTINDVQRQLGHNPGTDVFEMVRIPGAGRFSNGSWLNGFAEQKIWTADFGNITYLRHDTTLDDHVPGWIGTPPEYCQKIARYAAKLLSTYKPEVISLSEGQRPVYIGQFLDGIDDLAAFVRPIMTDLVYATSHQPEDPAVAQAVIRGIHAKSLRLELGYGKNNNHMHELLKYIGLLKPGSPEPYFRQAEAIERKFIAHIAKTLIKVEEIKPREDTEEGQRKIALWHNIYKVATGEVA